MRGDDSSAVKERCHHGAREKYAGGDQGREVGSHDMSGCFHPQPLGSEFGHSDIEWWLPLSVLAEQAKVGKFKNKKMAGRLRMFWLMPPGLPAV